MIKNVVFDIGNVLIDYSPKSLTDTFDLSDTERELLLENVFASSIWLLLDKGACSMAEAIEVISEKIPRYTEYVRRIFTEESLELLFSEMSGTVEYMREIKQKGYKTYLLSNFSREGFDFIYKRYSFLKEFDGMIISSHVGINKPDRGIYECLLNKYSLNALETVFFDDLEKNCAGAEQLGIRAVQFTNLEDVKAKFNAMIKE